MDVGDRGNNKSTDQDITKAQFSVDRSIDRPAKIWHRLTVVRPTKLSYCFQSTTRSIDCLQEAFPKSGVLRLVDRQTYTSWLNLVRLNQRSTGRYPAVNRPERISLSDSEYDLVFSSDLNSNLFCFYFAWLGFLDRLIFFFYYLYKAIVSLFFLDSSFNHQ